jgi:AraC-like DNA-binding protein
VLLPSPSRAPVDTLTWPSALIVWGPGSWSDLHRHHCVQLVMALHGRLRMRERARQRWIPCGAVLMKPDAWHEVDARGTDVLIAFVEAESDFGAALLTRLTTNVTPVPDETVRAWRCELFAEGRNAGRTGGERSSRPGLEVGEAGHAAAIDKARVEQWVTQTLLQRGTSPSIDRRIKRALRIVRDNLIGSDDEPDAAKPKLLSLEVLAETVGLSTSRFMHLFTTSVGIPLRPYILWLRLQRAAAEIARGHSITAAAHAAGFADAAHLTRTFRRMLGATPRQIAQRGLAARDLHV